MKLLIYILPAIAIFSSVCNENAVIYRPLAMAALNQLQQEMRTITGSPDVVCELSTETPKLVKEFLGHADTFTTIKCSKKSDATPVAMQEWARGFDGDLYLQKTQIKDIPDQLKQKIATAFIKFFLNYRVALYRGYTSLKVNSAPGANPWKRKIQFPEQA